MRFCSVRRALGTAVLGFALFYFVLLKPAPWKKFEHLPEPLRPFRPMIVALLNDALKDVKFPSFVPESLLWMAQLKTGVSKLYEEDDPLFREGLVHLTESIENDAKLNFVGRVLTRAQLDISIENRLKVGDYYYNKVLPKESSTEAMKAPVFILGMPRSGSTFFHNLLSLDEDNFRAPRLWEIVDPVKPLGIEGNGIERAIRMGMSAFGTKIFEYLAPNFAAVHPVSSINAEECMPVLAISMVTYNFNTMLNVPTYNDWMLQQNQTKALLWHERFLKVLHSGGGDKIWLLKAPFHMNHLGDILRVYPNARIIVTHREPAGMLASLASLHARLYGLVTDDIDLKHIGAYQEKIWDIIVDRFVSTRRKIKQENPKLASQIIDLSHGIMSKDPIGAVKHVYNALGLTLSENAVNKMRDWLNNDIKLGKKGAAGKHEYKAEWFGLDEARIRKIPSFVEYSNDYL